ncbi:MAG: nitroreductase family protein [Treponema sp.]|nr:nitroreductase family protein [Treponema sp.]MCL2273205.1 nitroreductase family protein [Treponema sp.]
MTEKEKCVFDVIFSRRSIRRYVDGKPVEKEKIVKLLEAAMAAPSACNLQPWEFIVVTEKEKLKQLLDSTQAGKISCPLSIIICANTKNIPWEGQGWMIDCSAAVQNMMIAAAAMGLGSVWVGSHNEEAIRRLFNVPENIKVMNMVYFGYPDEKKQAGTRYTEDAVYWEKYDPQRKRTMRTMDMLSDLSVTPR